MRASGDAEALLDIFESSGDGQRGRCQNDGFYFVKKTFGENVRDVDGRGLQECAAAAPFHPEDVALVVLLFHDEAQGHREFHGTAVEREDLFGRVLQ